MGLLLVGIAVAFNIIIIMIKFKKCRYEDAVLDSILLTIVAIVFGGSYSGLVVGTISSAIISIYLLISPPSFTKKMS